MAYNKIIYGGKTLIDLTADTVVADKLLTGFTAHRADGEVIEGTCDYDMNTDECNAAASEILDGRIAGVKGSTVVGTMVNNACTNGTIKTANEEFVIPRGFHDGSGTVGINYTEVNKLIPENIRDGVTILGVVGTMSGSEDVKAQSKTVTPATTAQTILPDTGYNYLTQVDVAAIPYTESNNAAGGITVTIAG